jgi:hypothetical protein
MDLEEASEHHQQKDLEEERVRVGSRTPPPSFRGRGWLGDGVNEGQQLPKQRLTRTHRQASVCGCVGLRQPYAPFTWPPRQEFSWCGSLVLTFRITTNPQ